jgi:hypothetical protein
MRASVFPQIRESRYKAKYEEFFSSLLERYVIQRQTIERAAVTLEIGILVLGEVLIGDNQIGIKRAEHA